MKRNRRTAGFTLLDLIGYMGIAIVGVSAAITMQGAELQLARTQQGAFRDSAAAAEALHVLADDLRDSTRVAARHAGPGLVAFQEDGTIAIWFDREAEPGVLYRKLVVPGEPPTRGRVIARGVQDLTVEQDEATQLLTAKIEAGAETRTLTVRRRP